MSELAAIRTVLGAYRSTAAHISEQDITRAWTQFDLAHRLIAAQARLILLLGNRLPELRSQRELARDDVAALSRALMASDSEGEGT